MTPILGCEGTRNLIKACFLNYSLESINKFSDILRSELISPDLYILSIKKCLTCANTDYKRLD